MIVDQASSEHETRGVREIHVLPVQSLSPGDSPRLSGVSNEHVVRLAECYAHLPPIVVHRQTMRVIDGVHRLQAAIQTGQKHVEVTYFDGGSVEAFILAVELNVRHGLPLSLPERRAAANRILASGTDLSDRAIAVKTGLSDKTIAAIRRRSGADIPHLETRRGRDGRTYPVGITGRQRAEQLLFANPSAPVREIALAAGVSPATVSAIRKRQHLDRDQYPEAKHGSTGKPAPGATGSRGKRPRQSRDKKAVLAQLRSDPSVWGKEAGRDLLRWLHAHAIGIEDFPGSAEAIPPHSVMLVATLAQQVGEAWLEFARRLEVLEHQAEVS